MESENEKLIQNEGEVIQIDEKNSNKKDNKNKSQKEGGCMKSIEDCLISIIKGFYSLIIGYILYPIKERFFQMANDLDLAMNPYKDPNYQEI